MNVPRSKGLERTSCRACAASLPDLAEGRLDASLRPALEAHLANCPACAAALAEIEVALAALADSDVPAAPPADDLRWTALHERVWSDLRQAPRRSRPVLALWAPAVAAALLILIGGLWLLGGRDGGGADRLRDIEQAGRGSLADLAGEGIILPSENPGFELEDELAALLTARPQAFDAPERAILGEGLAENPRLWDAMLAEELDDRPLEELIDGLDGRELERLSMLLQELSG